MSRAKDWTFKALSNDGTAAAAVSKNTSTWSARTWGLVVTAACLAFLGIGFAIGWVATDGYFGIFDPVDKTTGSHIWSAMELRKVATGNASDDDLEQIVYFVLGDMGGLWTYRELVQRGNVLRMDIVLWYHPDRSQPGRFEYNSRLEQRLPDRMDRLASRSWWGTSQNTGAHSCICGQDYVNIMEILYSEDSAMHRVAVVAHEYYHVLQIHYCPTVYNDCTHFVMWLSEGAATVMQNLYITHWLSNHPFYHDMLFDQQHGHVRQMIEKVQSGDYTYNAALNTHDGAHGNYVASTTALLYLMQVHAGRLSFQRRLRPRRQRRHGRGFPQRVRRVGDRRRLLRGPQHLPQERHGGQHRAAATKRALRRAAVQPHRPLLRRVRVQSKRSVRHQLSLRI
jgi:hypothetical protein